jgi:hypothetical protein
MNGAKFGIKSQDWYWCLEMRRLDSEIIKANPICNGLNTFRNSFEPTCRGLVISGLYALYQMEGKGTVHRQLAKISNISRTKKSPA